MDTLKELFAQLDVNKSTADNVESLIEIGNVWYQLGIAGTRVTELMHGNVVLLVLSKVMEEMYEEWRDWFPAWVYRITFGASLERNFENELFSAEHLAVLEAVFRKYLLNGNNGCITAYISLASFASVKQLLLRDDQVYNIIKRKLHGGQLAFLYTLTGSEEWQLKMLSDQKLISNMLALPDNDDVWDLFIALAGHPDAKTLLPKVILVQANKSKYERKMELCALLCSEDDLKLLRLNSTWIEEMAYNLQLLVTKGTALVNKIYYDLLDAVLPIVNLSVVEAQKEILGKQFISLFMRVVTEELPASPFTTRFVARARQEVSKAMWNLAYLESNRNLIANENGVEKLNIKLASTDDPLLKQNIYGILHMFTNAPSSLVRQSDKNGHVMISYHWRNQQIVKRIAKSLQDTGYNVWLDVDQAGGSTLEAMALAIERAEMVLICMSQNYKDSPNCRLEAEYCVNRKVPYVPLAMQKGYSPDGWLGTTLGSKLYYEFTDEESWDGKMLELMKAIGNHGKTNASKATVTHKVINHQPSLDLSDENEELLAWMKAERIDQHFELFKRHKLTKRGLLGFRARSPNNLSFFFSAFTLLGIAEQSEVLQLSYAVYNLK